MSALESTLTVIALVAVVVVVCYAVSVIFGRSDR